MVNEKAAILLLGSNTGHRALQLQQALALIRGLGNRLQTSQVYETDAWGNRQQAPFLNQVARLHTPLTARDLLAAVLRIEKTLGRQRTEKWGPRPMDVDILFFGDEVICEPDLQVPHPQIPFRRFTLVPLAELLPDLIHPTEQKSMQALLHACTDPLQVKPFATR